MTESEKVSDDGEWEELMGSDICVKRITPGSGVIAEMKMVVKADIEVYVKGQSQPVEVMHGASFKIGDGDAVPGLELPLRHSSVGEHFRARCDSKFAFGPVGRKGSGTVQEIPPNTDLEFDVKVLEHRDAADTSSLEATLFEVSIKKESGNRWFSYGDFMRAGRNFSQGGKAAETLLGNMDSLDDTEDGQMARNLFKLYVDCLNNLAACHLSVDDSFKAREACIKVLEMDPNNKKGLLRAGRASLGLHEYEESNLCFKRLLEIQEQEMLKLVTDKGRAEKETSESDNNLDSDISQLESQISVTKTWLKKVDIAKKKYKGRERGMAKKIAKGLFAAPKQCDSTEVEVSHTSPTDQLQSDNRVEELSIEDTVEENPVEDFSPEAKKDPEPLKESNEEHLAEPNNTVNSAPSKVSSYKSSVYMVAISMVIVLIGVILASLYHSNTV
mmetsp:Transcript_55/g.105  ORF Transcript_55/g.105 Transcript_55/m.105 type:complete len:443 (-) Transcript_55:73-1401(-)